jgi:hypothetical protein
MTKSQHNWLVLFYEYSLSRGTEHWLAALYASIAAVESAFGVNTITDGASCNEIGYDAVPGRPQIVAIETASGKPHEYRAFINRAQEIDILNYLAHHSKFYADARARFIRSFLRSYTGLSDVAQYLVLFNVLAHDIIHPVLYPVQVATEPTESQE